MEAYIDRWLEENVAPIDEAHPLNDRITAIPPFGLKDIVDDIAH